MTAEAVIIRHNLGLALHNCTPPEVYLCVCRSLSVEAERGMV